MRLILASTSPRRRQLLECFKLPFECVSPKFVEASNAEWTPQQEALSFAREKALSLRQDFPDGLIIGSDTIVELDGNKLGKPQDDADAMNMLRSLAGCTHHVLTGLALWDGVRGELQEVLAVSSVRMKAFDEKIIRAYIATGEPKDKAGAYAVQGEGSRLIEAVEGDFFTVVGLPLNELYQFLQDSGLDLPVSLPDLRTAAMLIR